MSYHISEKEYKKLSSINIKSTAGINNINKAIKLSNSSKL